MKNKNILKIAFAVFTLLVTNNLSSQTTIYSENFTGQNGKGAVGPTPTTDLVGVDWTIDISAATLSADTDWFQVQNEVFEARDIDGDAIWMSPSIDISAYTDILFSLSAEENGTMEASDIFVTEYRIDGGAWLEATTNGNLNDDFTSASVSQTGLNGNTIEIRVVMNNGADTEYHRLDDILVRGTPSGPATPGITLGTVSGNTTEAGTTATFTTVLTAQPTTDVVLTVLSADTGEVTVAPATLTFTNANWDTPQTVTATGVDDAISDGNQDVIITISVDAANSDDTYDAVAAVSTTVTNEDDDLPNIIINEILADPATTVPEGDANGDGLRENSSDDEFIEIVNLETSTINIGGYTISDSGGVVHTFVDPTNLPAGGSIVVFGGGTPTGIPGLTVVSSTGNLSLVNNSDTVTLRNSGGSTIDAYTYGSEGANDVSIARSPDLSGAFSQHTSIASNPVSFSPGLYNTSGLAFSVNTWTGATDNDWSTASNWSLGSLPTGSDDVQIIKATNQPTTSGAVTVNSVTIASGATLIATNTFTGSVTVKRNLATNNWYLLGMPVSGESIADMIANNDFDNTTSTVSNIGLSFYDNNQVSNQWTYATAASTGSFSETGYSAKFNNPGTITAVGNMRTTNVNVSLTNGTATGFNLIGNIYPSYLAANSNADGTNNLLSVNSSKLTETTLWFWNQATSTYNQINQASGAFHIAPSQGFFVQVSSNQSFSFTEAMQSHQSTDSFQKSASSTSKIELLLNDGTLNRKTEIYYINNTTTGFDNGYDSSIFGGASHEFTIFTELLSENTGKKLGIQSLPNSDFETMVIPVGITSAAEKEITFSAEAVNLPEGLKMFLEDRLTNTVTRLDETNTEYKVTLTDALNGIGRFYLHTKSSGVLSTTDVDLENISIYTPTKTTLRVAGLSQGKAHVKLYSILGNQVFESSFTSTGVYDMNLPKLASGIYIVQLKTEKGSVNKKISLQ